MPEGEAIGPREATHVVAGFGLADHPDIGPFVLDDSEWQAFGARLWVENLTGLAVAAMHAGVLQLSAERSEAVLERHRRAMVWCLRLEARLLELDDRFRRSGVEYAVLKGPAVAHTAYPDPSLRGFSDLDVLVKAREFAGACVVLREMGFQRIVAEPRPGFDERFGKAAAHRHTDDSMEIDLHRTLVLGPFGLWIAPDALLDRAVTFSLSDRQIPRLDDTGMLLSVAMHASLGWPQRLVPLRDVLQVSRLMNVDWAALADWASEWRLFAVLRHAFMTAEAMLEANGVAESRAFTSARVPRNESRALQTYFGERHGVGGTTMSTLRAIPGLRGKAAYVRALAFPGREFMNDRYPPGSKSSYGRRLMTPGRWALRRLANGRHSAAAAAEPRSD